MRGERLKGPVHSKENANAKKVDENLTQADGILCNCVIQKAHENQVYVYLAPADEKAKNDGQNILDYFSSGEGLLLVGMLS